MTRQLKVYGVADFPRSVHLSPAIMQALDEPPHHRQGCLYIWAPTAAAAYKRLTALGIAGFVGAGPRALGPAVGRDVEILQAARDWSLGTVLALRSTSGGPVVEINTQHTDQVRPGFTVTVVGELVFRRDLIFVPAGPVEPEITDEMITAALQASRANTEPRSPRDEMRAAIAAALKVQEGTP